MKGEVEVLEARGEWVTPYLYVVKRPLFDLSRERSKWNTT